MSKKRAFAALFFAIGHLLLAISFSGIRCADLYLVGKADTAKHSHLALRYLFALFCRQKCVGAGHRAKKISGG